MAIAVAVQVHDGIVLASDSASTLFLSHPDQKDKEPEVVNVYNNANKILSLHKGLAIGGMTFGAGSIGSASISTLAKDLRLKFSGHDKDHLDWTLNSASYTIQEVAQRVRQFLFDERRLKSITSALWDIWDLLLPGTLLLLRSAKRG